MPARFISRSTRPLEETFAREEERMARSLVFSAARHALAVAAGVAAAGASAAAQQPDSLPRRVASVAGFQTPESVRYDAGQDVFFVSNIAGNPSARDGVGFISRLGPDGTLPEPRFIEGGRDGVTLHAPKGMALRGDTLWVADIDAVRGFDRRSGRPLAVVDLRGHGAVFLNDVAVGADGALYVTDTGIVIDERGETHHPGPDRIFRVSLDSVEVVARGEALALPNGIAAAPDGGFLLAPADGRGVSAWTPGAPPRTLADGPGGYDGIEVLADERVLVSSWADSAVHELRDGALHPLVRGVPSPADLGVGPRGLLAIPLFTENRVELWLLPERRR